jgi:hypothetical protein
MAARMRIPFLDDSGDSVDMAELVDDAGPQDEMTAEVRIREVITTRNCDLHEVTATISDYSTGTITFRLPSEVYDNPGVYNLEMALYDDTDDGVELVMSNKLYLWIDRGLFGDPRYPNAGPPNIDEIRLSIRDNAPEENRLLDDFEFDLAEICHATETGVRIWNESQPPINVNFTTINYCVRSKWIQYIAGHMFQVAAHRFRRNHLPYQAGGLSVDDQNKFQQYDQVGMML